MNKTEFILKDFLESIENRKIQTQTNYERLYLEETDYYKKIFAYFHGSFNNLFEFLNTKNKMNKHYNAETSRDLIALIEEFENLARELNQVGQEIVIKEIYKTSIEYCKKFIRTSGGSPIPEDFQPIQIIKYDPIFELPNRIVHIPVEAQRIELRVVGQGAFSVVQKYKDTFYNKFFAVKQAKKTLDERELERFKREFEILQSLNFPYILEVHGYDKQKNSYTMEYCDSTLYEYITKRNSNLAFINRKKLALQFLYGINYIHKKKILHRDISYSNILIKHFDCGAIIIKLSDFGLMKENESKFTKSETEIKGTIIDPYLEKFKDYNELNEIYAVGVILKFIFTGKQNLKPDQSQISKVVEKCTDKVLSARYQNIAEIIKEVEKIGVPK